jgi:hypothetical protein
MRDFGADVKRILHVQPVGVHRMPESPAQTFSFITLQSAPSHSPVHVHRFVFTSQLKFRDEPWVLRLAPSDGTCISKTMKIAAATLFIVPPPRQERRPANFSLAAFA